MLALLCATLMIGVITLVLNDDTVASTEDQKDIDENSDDPSEHGDDTLGDDLIFMDDEEVKWIDAGEGDDTVYASSDCGDTLLGGNGDDKIYGTSDDSRAIPIDGNMLFGGDGDDTLRFAGTDIASGGQGDDVFVAAGLHATVTDFDENTDVLQFEVYDGLDYSIFQKVTEEGVLLSVTPNDEAYTGHAVLLQGLTAPVDESRIELARTYIP